MLSDLRQGNAATLWKGSRIYGLALDTAATLERQSDFMNERTRSRRLQFSGNDRDDFDAHEDVYLNILAQSFCVLMEP
jgi:hypothetical protein